MKKEIEPKIFTAKIHHTKRFALIAKINQFGRRAKIKLRLEHIPSQIMQAYDDLPGLKQFLINDGLLSPQDRLRLKVLN